jgi:hypothetical protein
MMYLTVENGAGDEEALEGSDEDFSQLLADRYHSFSLTVGLNSFHAQPLLATVATFHLVVIVFVGWHSCPSVKVVK